MCNGKGHSTFIGSKCKGETQRKATHSPTAERPVGLGECEADAGRVPGYFTPSQNTVDNLTQSINEQDLIEVETEYECVAVGCRSRFCTHCCKALGHSLRHLLIPVLQTFTAMMMLTLTIDPKLFHSPEHAYRYVRKKRSVAELVRALHKAGYLKSRRFFYVVEWQKNSHMAHFHLLVESDFIPFEKLAEYWGRNRPPGLPPRQGNEPAFGHVRFSDAKFANPEHAAHYACKYLTKLPSEGFPQWVLNFEGQIRMFATSRGLLPQPERKEKPPYQPKVHSFAKPPHSDLCFCGECRGETPEKFETDREPISEKRTIAKRLERCGVKAAIIAVPVMMKPDGELIDGKKYFVAPVAVPYRDVLHLLEIEQDKLRRFRLREGEYEKLQLLREAQYDPEQSCEPELYSRVKNREHITAA